MYNEAIDHNRILMCFLFSLLKWQCNQHWISIQHEIENEVSSVFFNFEKKKLNLFAVKFLIHCLHIRLYVSGYFGQRIDNTIEKVCRISILYQFSRKAKGAENKIKRENLFIQENCLKFEGEILNYYFENGLSELRWRTFEWTNWKWRKMNDEN